ncbi:hypothetical protein POM88_012640 [Heracleum sosnowskyi]|uniref:F-box associated beta-propeller type 3 domain-containing protein n=1 Tax=Heracleum sosnowskyi TaxID=360622 RepID=A0AAD8IYK2_9APIA|nr:hypothetical protein POM88_012640 [Heracleum sosnowskyi]
MNGGGELISFELRNDIFKLIEFPNVNFRSMSKIFDYEGCVGLILEGDDDESLTLWTLDDADDDGSDTVSWTKKINVETGFRIDWTTIYLGKGQFVTSERSKRIILYDYKKKEIRKFRHQTWYNVKPAHKYTESLVSVKGFTKY